MNNEEMRAVSVPGNAAVNVAGRGELEQVNSVSSPRLTLGP